MFKRDFQVLKLYLILCLTIVLFSAMEKFFKLFSILQQNDPTYLCWVILFVFIAGILTGFYEVYNGLRMVKTLQMADMATSVGLLGTIVGIAVSFYGISQSGFDFSNPETVNIVAKAIFEGLGTAFTTTVAGLIAAITLNTYIFFCDTRK